MTRIRLSAAILLVLFSASSAAAQLAVKGDAAAWQEIRQAYDRLFALRSYRTKLTSADTGSTTIFELVKPDRMRTVQYLGNLTIESIIVGGEGRIRRFHPGEQGVWNCVTLPRSSPPGPDPKALKGEVTVARLGEVTIGGARAQKFSYSLTLSGKSTRKRVYVLVDGRIVSREELLGNGDKILYVWEYYDFNTPIKIELPWCQRPLRP